MLYMEVFNAIGGVMCVTFGTFLTLKLYGLAPFPSLKVITFGG